MPARVMPGCSPMQFLTYTKCQHCLVDVAMNMDHTGEVIQDRLVDDYRALDKEHSMRSCHLHTILSDIRTHW